MYESGDDCVSSVEKFLFIMKLIRLVDDIPPHSISTTRNDDSLASDFVNNCVIINNENNGGGGVGHQPVQIVSSSSSSSISLLNELAECRKKLKLMLLEDLYALNKFEKNWLQMSLIRKQQADLLEWIPLSG